MKFLGVVFVLFICPIVVSSAEPASTSHDRLLGAYYYPWYFPERWINEPVTHTPRLGHYSSDRREVAAQHIAWAKQADLDFFVVSWLSAEGREGTNLRQALLPELDQAQFRFALLYETPLALGLPAGQPLDLSVVLPDGVKAGDRMVEHFDYLADVYLKHDRYLRYDGKAVVLIYLVRDLVNAGPYLTAIRQRLAGHGVELYLIADAVYWQAPETLDWALLKEHFQAITAYNMYHRPDFLTAVRDQFQAAEDVAQREGLRLIPNVMPGYDDTPLRGADRVTIDRREGQFYRDFWDIAADFVGPEQPFLLITSFNEWHEGTELEPSAEYGEMYLKLTKELAGGLSDEHD